MTEVNLDRAVIITAAHGEKFMGWIPKDKEDPKRYLDQCVARSEPVELHNVRNLIGHTQQQGNRFVKIMALMAIDMFPAALPVYHVVPSCWYFPVDDEVCAKQVRALLKTTDANEANNKALTAGIIPAGVGDLPPPPGRPGH